MRILLQHPEGDLYLKEPGVWTADLNEALDFGSSLRAIKFVRQHRLQGVQVLVAFVDQACVDTVALSLPDRQPVAAAAR